MYFFINPNEFLVDVQLPEMHWHIIGILAGFPGIPAGMPFLNSKNQNTCLQNAGMS
jgi:hypothetical protein